MGFHWGGEYMFLLPIMGFNGDYRFVFFCLKKPK